MPKNSPLWTEVVSFFVSKKMKKYLIRNKHRNVSLYLRNLILRDMENSGIPVHMERGYLGEERKLVIEPRKTETLIVERQFFTSKKGAERESEYWRTANWKVSVKHIGPNPWDWVMIAEEKGAE